MSGDTEYDARTPTGMSAGVENRRARHRPRASAAFPIEANAPATVVARLGADHASATIGKTGRAPMRPMRPMTTPTQSGIRTEKR
ncbi:hypothetical protein DR62_06225 [Burkholderia thailandensis]|nr:hypothetical protein DR62_06225 [Burkholderia thailandensis]AOI53071.1 hypothetical protein WI24_15490 [Burkholderia thailandensis]AOJ52080.1 hypothetical protein AQ475_15465 [Burkholderia thailandensis]AVR24433.1 hypothetical protein A8H32_04205 [Burkholderia thailandensis]MDD1480165.1 hypothetical protein [Burkholderia thailandensis]